MIDSMNPQALEANYLDLIWDVRRYSQAERLEALKWLAQVVIERGPTWDYAAVRADPTPPALHDEACFVCTVTDMRTYRHHVIQVQHGGSNSRRNVVTLCHACHKKIHPWLDPSTSYERRGGFTKVGHMIERMIDHLARLFEARKR